MFYKNVLLVLPQWWFGIYCLFSGQNFYFDGLYQIFNMAFTGLPIFVFGVLDKDVNSHNSLGFPQLYADGRNKTFFSPQLFWQYMTEAFASALLILFFAAGTFAYSWELHGKGLSVWDIGSAVIFAVIVLANLRLCYETKTWNWLFMLFLWGSVMMWFVFMAIYDKTGLYVWDNMNGVLGSFGPLMGMPSFWLYIVLAVTVPWMLFFTQLSWQVTFIERPPARMSVMEKQYGYNRWSRGPRAAV
jgi:magnesium-transporting ATPase (P-type)